MTVSHAGKTKSKASYVVIAQYAVQTITAGGRVDLKFIDNSCLLRHRITQAEVIPEPPLKLIQPGNDTTLATLCPEDNCTIFSLMSSVRTCARRGGAEILQVLGDLLQYRLLGGGPGEVAHKLVDKFMTCVHGFDNSLFNPPLESIYGNNPIDPGNKQRMREANRGDLAAQSPGFRTHQMLAAKVKQGNFTLTGESVRVDVDCITAR